MTILVGNSQELFLLSFFAITATHSVQLVIRYFTLITTVLASSVDLLLLVGRARSIPDGGGTISHIIVALTTNIQVQLKMQTVYLVSVRSTKGLFLLSEMFPCVYADFGPSAWQKLLPKLLGPTTIHHGLSYRCWPNAPSAVHPGEGNCIRVRGSLGHAVD